MTAQVNRMRPMHYLTAALATLMLGLGPAIAQVKVEKVELSPGMQKIISVGEAFQEIHVGRDTVADAIPQPDNRVLIRAKEPGFSSILLTTPTRGEIAEIQVSVVSQESYGRNPVTVWAFEHQGAKIGEDKRNDAIKQQGTGQKDTSRIIHYLYRCEQGGERMGACYFDQTKVISADGAGQQR
jgi:Pilus formation protein N terminal region